MKTKAATLLTPAALVLAPAAFAQQNYQDQHPFHVRVGANYFTDNTVRRATQNVGLLIGAGYDLPFHGVLSPQSGQSSIDFDWNHTEGHGNRYDGYNFMYVERIPFQTGPGSTNNGVQPYFGLGVGVFLNRASGGGSAVAMVAARFQPGALGTTTSSRGSINRTQVGGKVMLGVRFQQNFFVEGAFTFQGISKA